MNKKIKDLQKYLAENSNLLRAKQPDEILETITTKVRELIE